MQTNVVDFFGKIDGAPEVLIAPQAPLTTPLAQRRRDDMATRHSSSQRAKEHIVYALCDPRNGEIRYIGQTSYNLATRIRGHLSDARRKDATHVARWIHVLISEGFRPFGRVLDSTLFPELLGDLERKWIVRARKEGARLTNITDGGDGGMLGWKPSAETLAKLKARKNAWKGRKHTPESIEKMRVSCKRLWAERADLREAQSLRHKGKTLSPEHRKRIGDGSRSAWKSPEYRARMAAVRAASAAFQEGYKRRAEKLRGRKRNPAAVAATAAGCMKPVVDQHGTVYPSRRHAAESIGAQQSNIWAVVSGRRPHVRGFVFREWPGDTNGEKAG